MSYLQFLMIFIVPLIIVELFYLKNKILNKKLILGLLFLSFMALVYTTPWDNYLVKTQIWSYGPDRVLGVIGHVPIEEYCFFILQTIFTGLFLFAFKESWGEKDLEKRNFSLRLGGTLFFLLLTALGAYSISITKARYLGLILAWASPVLGIQWAFGGDYFLRNWKLYAFAITVPTLYLWGADAFAIRDKIWEIAATTTTGPKIWILPIEEALFFLMTNIMVVQGLLLFWWYFPLKNKVAKCVKEF